MSKLINFLKKQKVAKAEDLLHFVKNRMELSRIVKKGEIKKIGENGSGFYSLPEENELEVYLLAVSKYYPKAIVSSSTALSLYELSENYIGSIDVDLLAPSGIRNSILNVHQVSQKRLCGIVERKFHGIKVNIYSPERSLYEPIFYDGVSSESFFKAVFFYRKKFKIDYDSLIKFDQLFKENVLSYIQMGDANEGAY